MIYHSCLLIDVGSNPDRPRPGRLWLQNLYRVHQRLCMAFPSKERSEDDPHFIKSYRHPEPPSNGGPSLPHVHVSRSSDTGFLFRIEPTRDPARFVILVQSVIEPDWNYAFANAGFLVSSSVRELASMRFNAGERLKFRLRACPTRSESKSRDGETGEKPRGKRRCIREESMRREWLKGKLKGTSSYARGADGKLREDVVPAATFEDREVCIVEDGIRRISASKGDGVKVASAIFGGTLRVGEPEEFEKIVLAGIGRGKAYGFGLLSLEKTSD